MKITQVTYSRLANLGNYSNERIELTAAIDDRETPEEAIEALKLRVVSMLGESETRMEQRRTNLRHTIRELEDKLDAARKAWETASTFMKAQGLKTDTPVFPDVTLALLPFSEKTALEVVDAEPDDGYDDDAGF